MTKIQILLSNLKNQNPLIIFLVALTSNAIYGIWSQLPVVTTIMYGSALPPISPELMPPYVVGSLLYFINMLLCTIGLSLLIPKKGALIGFSVGLIVAIFFAMNGYLSAFAPNIYTLPSTETLMVSFISFLLFYGLPGILLGHLRKE